MALKSTGSVRSPTAPDPKHTDTGETAQLAQQPTTTDNNRKSETVLFLSFGEQVAVTSEVWLKRVRNVLLLYALSFAKALQPIDDRRCFRTLTSSQVA